MAEVNRPSGGIGCTLIITLLVLCIFVAALHDELGKSRYASGATLECGTGKTQRLPLLTQIILIIPPQNCWTDWVQIPKRPYNISTDSSITEQLFYEDRTTEIWQNSPELYRRLEKKLLAVRFKNDSSLPITITIRFTGTN